MPVFDAAYRTWDGERRSAIWRLLAFPKFTFMQVSGKRAVQMVFVVSWIPFLAFLTYIYVSVNVKLLQQLQISTSMLVPVDERFFASYMFCQLPFLFFFTLMLGPGLIATDIRHQALPMILSKPINRWQYLFGKFSVLFILLSAISWLPATILYVAQTTAVPKAHDWLVNFWSHSLWIYPRMLLFALVVIVTLNLLVLFFSSLTQNSRFAGVALVMFIIGSMIVGPIAAGIFNNNSWLALSPVANLITAAHDLFGDAIKAKTASWLAWLYFALLWSGCVFFLARRVRAFHLYHE